MVTHSQLRVSVWVVIGLTVANGCQRAANDADRTPRSSEPPIVAESTVDFSPAGLQTDEVLRFYLTLKKAGESNDRDTVAALVSYPLAVQTETGSKTFATPDEFLAAYNLVMTERVITALTKSDYEHLFSNYQGVRVGRGEIWFGGVYEDGAETYTVKIIGINPGD